MKHFLLQAWWGVALIGNNVLLSKSACAAAKSKLLRIDHISILRPIDLVPCCSPICSKQGIGTCSCIGTTLSLQLSCTYKFKKKILLCREGVKHKKCTMLLRHSIHDWVPSGGMLKKPGGWADMMLVRATKKTASCNLMAALMFFWEMFLLRENVNAILKVHPWMIFQVYQQWYLEIFSFERCQTVYL